MDLGEVAPTADALLSLEADELGLRMLPVLVRPHPHGGHLSLKELLDANIYQVTSINAGTRAGGPYPAERHAEVRQAIIEAWAWLEGQGLLIPALGPYNDPNMSVRLMSRRGRQLAEDPQRALSARLLPKEVLHPSIREDVWGLYHRGKYDAAVFEAMKAVEIAVRQAANPKPTDIGVDLMRRAFNPEGGPLTDKSAPAAEQHARSALFAGAMGSYKNPQSHRKVDLDNPDETAEIIMLACHLLRIVTDRNSVFS
ncbi:TIGR02391 family protein [Methylobacterium sp. WL6]|uniref:TIGR02391 family protein n=1 Tax=Methylobacterium sp. WL6 TaxID=2603901 RepID=UPI0011CAF1B6|nr:TIGR02391 family protein [Methylobacterium sp. WL6]TXN73442.1 TIGR02391 family protein [Methylobacterium sp. WL6]